MKSHSLNFKLQFVIIVFLIISCSGNKNVVSLDDELSEDKIIIIGTIEFDYSKLENKGIKGVDVFFESEMDSKNFVLSQKLLPNDRTKKYQFISKVGQKGDYELKYQQNMSSSETGNLISLMDIDRNTETTNKKTLQKYSLNDCKIINIGKVVVYYSNDKIDNGNISYSYSFTSFGSDTLALNAFKESYPKVYESYRNDICTFKGE